MLKLQEHILFIVTQQKIFCSCVKSGPH